MSLFDDCKGCNNYQELRRAISLTPEELPKSFHCKPCPTFQGLHALTNKDYIPQTEQLLSTDLIDSTRQERWPTIATDIKSLLTPIEATIMSLYRLGYSLREIGTVVSLHPQQCDRLIKKIAIKLSD